MNFGSVLRTRVRASSDGAFFAELAHWTSQDHRCCAWLTYNLVLTPFKEGSEGGQCRQP